MQYAFHDAALRLLKQVPNFPKLRILELGCGDGVMLEQLLKLGADARGTTYLGEQDYIRERPYPAGLPVDQGVDLNKPLPYPDASFDAVYTTEVLEHVEGHINFLTEAARVLKPGGSLVLTTPNQYHLTSRLAFALTGHVVRNRELTPWSAPIQRVYEFHHRMPDFPHMHYLLWRSGLRIKSMDNSQTIAPNYPLMLAYPFVWAYGTFAGRARSYDTPEDAQGRRDLARWMNSPTMCMSSQICFRAEKAR